MPGTLYVVATPIGNLEDVTLRGLRVLREADLVAAEDTRRTARLLARHAISTPTISFHEHNTRSRLPQLISRLEAGESIALVSDAGTPGISDPGVELVRACVESQIPIDPIPGVSAPLAAAVASGFPLTPLTICGFPPSRLKDRTSWLEEIYSIQNTLTFFEAPHRIASTLKAAADIFGERPIMLGRELTKVHQEFLRGSAGELSERLQGLARGEFTVVMGPMTKHVELRAVSDDDIVREFGQIAKDAPLSRRGVIAATARRLGVSSRTVYLAIEQAKNRS
jgi:16S rRNA (cytidine1402-2'-O)-methyltransferase